MQKGLLLVIACLVAPSSGGSPPTLVRQPPDGDQPFRVGRAFTLECQATGDPRPTYSWTKDEQPLNSSEDRIVQLEGSLLMDLPLPSDKGLYQCSAHNALGTAFSNVVRLVLAMEDEGSLCGNSLVDEGEECDAGGGEDACCDASCKLREGAACSDKNSLCCRRCELARPGLMCRDSQPLHCATEAFCTGISEDCPKSLPYADGSQCLDGGRCYAGECRPYCELHPCDGVPLEAPKNFRLLFLQDARTAKFAWDPVSPESVRGPLRGYKIRTWADEEGEDKSKEQVVWGSSSEALVGLFRPFSRNLVRILAFNDLGDGPPSDTLDFVALQDTPGPVSELSAIPFGSSALYLRWKRPAEPNGILTGYLLYHKEASEEGPGERSFVEHFPETRTLLTGLRANATYRVSVCAATHIGMGQKAHIEATTLDREGARKAYSALAALLNTID